MPTSPLPTIARRFHAGHALLPEGWAHDVVIDVDRSGSIAGVETGASSDGATSLGRYVIPGMPNLHSHAFQRAMAGLAERVTHATDSFWTWRETMYRFAGRIEPDTLNAIAAQLYAELLEQGYTSVCEFHYLHHRPDGEAYEVMGATAHALVDAARETGIGLTLLPTLYMVGGFDERPLGERQQRFGHDVEGFLRLLDAMRAEEDAQTCVGLALHSIRAVPLAAMQRLFRSPLAQEGPVHIHIAEQRAEVDECRATRGTTPVAWLLDNVAVDERWCLVHATHLTPTEVRGLARSGAIAGLCPTTEANLGDGLFPLTDFRSHGGTWGVGSDSHISVSPIEDLRWLEYGQRLTTLQRNVVADEQRPSTGANLWQESLEGGAQASGRAIGSIAVGQRADWLVIDDTLPVFAGRNVETMLDTFVFAGNRSPVRDVYVGGQRVVESGRHVRGERIAERYRAAVRRLSG